MNKLLKAGLLFLVGALSASCISKATEDEVKQMCENLVRLRGEVELVTVSDAITVVEEDYKRRRQQLDTMKEQDIKDWDDELSAKLADAENEDEKAKLRKEYAERQKEVIARYEPQIVELEPSKKEAMERAKQRAKDSEMAWVSEVDRCVSSALEEGVNQTVAQCRITAESTDKYWNGCR